MSDSTLQRAADAVAGSTDPVLRSVGNLLAAVAAEEWCCEACKYDPVNDNRTVLAAFVLAEDILRRDL